MAGERGFTLLELLIVVVLIAIVATMAIPSLFAARASANETAAIATLRSIASAQAQFQGSAKADLDYDGLGEYGTLMELSGGANVRAGTAAEKGVLQPPVLSTGFRKLTATGESNRSGYFFQVFLPGFGGVAECPDETGDFTLVDPDLSETTWCAYAWPTKVGNTGHRIFMLNQAGTMVAASNVPYSGAGGGPEAGAAFLSGGAVDSITGNVAVGTSGRDGRVWRQVN